MPKEITQALDMKIENPFYQKYLKNKDKFLKKRLRKYSPEEVNKIDYENSDYYFLCFMTRKYFRDNIFVSMAKIILGICSIFLLILVNKFVHKGKWLKSIVMMLLIMYAIVSIPLSVLYIIANLFCLIRYKEFITTRDSVLAKKINFFYKEDTDKLLAVNWKSVFKNDYYDYAERKRMRGW